MKFGTKAIHAGQEPDPTTGAVMTPIYQTSTYWQKTPGDNKGYEYSRGTNPTRKALEDCLAALENAKHGLAFSSGLGATDSVMKLLAPGDEVITGDDLYGGSYRMFTKILIMVSSSILSIFPNPKILPHTSTGKPNSSGWKHLPIQP